jgi:hypothetical protein
MKTLVIDGVTYFSIYHSVRFAGQAIGSTTLRRIQEQLSNFKINDFTFHLVSEEASVKEFKLLVEYRDKQGNPAYWKIENIVIAQVVQQANDQSLPSKTEEVFCLFIGGLLKNTVALLPKNFDSTLQSYPGKVSGHLGGIRQVKIFDFIYRQWKNKTEQYQPISAWQAGYIVPPLYGNYPISDAVIGGMAVASSASLIAAQSSIPLVNIFLKAFAPMGGALFNFMGIAHYPGLSKTYASSIAFFLGLCAAVAPAALTFFGVQSLLGNGFISSIIGAICGSCNFILSTLLNANGTESFFKKFKKREDETIAAYIQRNLSGGHEHLNFPMAMTNTFIALLLAFFLFIPRVYTAQIFEEQKLSFKNFAEAFYVRWGAACFLNIGEFFLFFDFYSEIYSRIAKVIYAQHKNAAFWMSNFLALIISCSFFIEFYMLEKESASLAKFIGFCQGKNETVDPFVEGFSPYLSGLAAFLLPISGADIIRQFIWSMGGEWFYKRIQDSKETQKAASIQTDKQPLLPQKITEEKTLSVSTDYSCSLEGSTSA